MKSSEELFGDHRHTSSQINRCLRFLMRSGVMLSTAFVGCLYLLTMDGAVALSKIPTLPAHATVSSVSTLPHDIYYYYRGRHYPYRYHGAYYGHRYYRYGHWYYY
jgi:hypothetical protein